MEGLGVTWSTLLAQIINFVILLGLLYLVAYKPILRMFDERSRRIKESMEQTESIREQAARADEDVKKRMEEAGKEGQEVISRAMRTGEEARQKIQQEARQEAEAILERARLEIQRERDEAVDELRQEFADLTIEAAGKVIEKSLDKEAHRQLIDKVLEESTTLKKK
jgi:F-type H+-transporting ATPase subunit b